MTSNYFLILSFLFTAVLSQLQLNAQQLPLFTQYREYHSYINPATISPDYITKAYPINFGASYRRSFSGIEQAPYSIFAKSDWVINTNNAFDLAIGGFFLSNNTTPIATNGVYGKIAALFTDDPYYGAFSVGLTFGALQYRVFGDKLVAFHVNDVVLSEGTQQQITPDVGFGTYYYKQFVDGALMGDVFFAGISVPRLFGFNTQFKNDNGSFNIKQERHYYGYIGMYKYFNETTFIEPSIWIKYVANTPVQVDFNIRYQHRQLFWVGTGASTANLIHFEVGFFVSNPTFGNTSNLKIGYGFDYAYGPLKNPFGTAHELNIVYMLDTKRLR